MNRSTNGQRLARVLPLRVKNESYVNYSYLLINPATNQAAIVDPAWEIETITRALPASVALTDILVTHSHPDHVDLVLPLAECFDACISLSPWGTLAVPATMKTNFVTDETPFFAAGLEVKPLVTPGHTSDSICYLIGNDLFSGDTLFAEGCGLCTYDTSDPSQLFRSLMRLKRDLHNSVRIFPGHSFGCTPGLVFSEVLARNIYLHLESEDQFVAFRTRPGQTHAFEFH